MVHISERATKSNRSAHAVNYLEELRPQGPWLLTAIPPNGGKTTTATFTDLEEARRFIVECNDDGDNVYYSLNRTKRALNSKAAKADIAWIDYLHVDADPNDNERPQEFKEWMRKRIRDFKHPPTFVIDSGNGLHLLWELRKPVEVTDDIVIADIEARNYALAEAFDADPSTRDICRILRVPGTRNYPNAKKRKLGRRECEAERLTYRRKVYDLDAFPPAEPRDDNREAHTRDQTGSGYGWRYMADCKARGLAFAEARKAILADTGKAGEWAGRTTERELERAYERPPAQRERLHSWDDPDISLLDDRRGELPDFPLDVLEPEKLRSWALRAAAGSGTSVDHVIVPTLGIASGLIGAARRVQPIKSWTTPMTMWTALIGFSGTGKTPGLDVPRLALDAVQDEQEDAIAELQREHTRKVAVATAAREVWKSELKTAQKNRTAMPPMPDAAEMPEPFVAPRLFTSDSTVEAMAILLTARPQGMMFITDELARLFLNMSRYSNGQDNQFWLESWDGKSFHQNRVSRKPIKLDRLLVGMVGGMQPDKLAQCFKGDADGMYARVLFSWPAEPPYRSLTDNIEPIAPELKTIFSTLAFLDERPAAQKIPLSRAALAAFDRFRRQVHDGKNTLDGREREWWAKMPAHVLRLAGTLALIYWVLEDGGRPEPNKIAYEDIAAAITLVRDYFWPHARAALRQIGLTERHGDARRVLHWLAANRDSEVSRENIRVKALGRGLDANATQDVIDYLERSGWLRVISHKTGGRSLVRYEVNYTKLDAA
jgi:hypothetical protein